MMLTPSLTQSVAFSRILIARVALATRAQDRARAELSLDRQAGLLDLLFRRIAGIAPDPRA